MSGFATDNTDHLIMAEVYSGVLKETLQDELMATRFVTQLSGFDNGDTFNIPSIGDFVSSEYNEGDEITIQRLDTGNYTFVVNQYFAVGTAITEKFKQDSWQAEKLISSFVPKMQRAIMEQIEADVLALSSVQTADNANEINGFDHRFVGSDSNETLDIEDLFYAATALDETNVPYEGRVGIISPSAAYKIETHPNFINGARPNPQWEDVLGGRLRRGMRFVNNIAGFDLYVSNRLPTANETIGGRTTTSGVANMFFSALPEVETFHLLMRQQPRVEYERVAGKQSDRYYTTARWGTGLNRPEALVTILTDTDQVGS